MRRICPSPSSTIWNPHIDLATAALALAMAACASDDIGGPVGDGGMCSDTRSCNGGRVCCDEGEECVDGAFCLPICEQTRCGDNGSICCGAGQICLDGVVCSAQCAPEQSVCGANLDTCCAAGDACVNDQCITPGDDCADDFDCLTEGDYCELTIGRCLPIPDVMPACEVVPDFTAVELETEWRWDEGIQVGNLNYRHVVAAPAVGDVSGDGIPDVVFPAYQATRDAILVALDGSTGMPLWHIGPGAVDPVWISSVALGNLDPSDDALEVVYNLDGGGIRVVDGDGVTELAVRRSGGANVAQSSPALADINMDGVPDIVVGCHAMNGLDPSDPAMDLFDQGECRSPTSGEFAATTVVADLDGDGRPEVTSGGIAVRMGATPAEQILWQHPMLTHGLPAVADLDVNGTPEVVVVRSGIVSVLAGADGSTLIGPGGTWHNGLIRIPGGGDGGAPTVADFDGDGLPEIATAGRGAYAVYDPDCLTTPPRSGGDCAPGTTEFLRWQAPTQDRSSSVTGSSVFDFQGDGVAEVVYHDECFLHVYDGRDGSEVLAEPFPSTSRTFLEYPLVVDVDRDGNSEIVVPNNNDQIRRDRCEDAWAAALGVDVSALPASIRGGTTGISVYGDPNDRWVRTRPIWNQFSYHVTNVDDRGGIPMSEADNWVDPNLNNYRQNVQGTAVFNAPNLTVELQAVARCADGAARLSAVVRNAGSRGVAAGVPIEFVRMSPTPEEVVDATTTQEALLPGATERITVTVTGIPVDTNLSFEVRVNGASASTSVVPECNEGDNTASATERCENILI